MRRPGFFSSLGLAAATILASESAWAGTVPVPEPGGLTLIGLAAAGGFLIRQLRKPR